MTAYNRGSQYDPKIIHAVSSHSIALGGGGGTKNTNMIMSFNNSSDLQNVDGLYMYSVSIPNTFHNVGELWNKLYIDVEDPASTWTSYTITVTPGFYSVESLSEELNTKIVAAVPNVTSVVLEESLTSGGFSKPVPVLKMTMTGTITEFRIKPVSDVADETSLNLALGADETALTTSSSLVLEFPKSFNLNTVPNVLITSVSLAPNQSHQTKVADGGDVSHILGIVDFTDIPYGFTKTHISDSPSNTLIHYTGSPKQIHNFDVQIRDTRNRILSLEPSMVVTMAFKMYTKHHHI